MKAVAGELPADDGWVFEVKWDGMRAVVSVAGPTDDGPGALRIGTTNGRDATAAFPELAGLPAALGVRDAILDGELVALDDGGRPDFGLLQARMHVTSPRTARERAATTPCTLALFDLLALDGTDVTGLPWRDRRRLLEALVPDGPHWQVPAVHDDGVALLEAARTRGMEGVVAKRTDSPYRPGGRSPDWRKVKVRRRQELVVGGWAPGTGGRGGRIGGLLVGFHEEHGGPLRYAGRVGSGLSDAELTELDGILGRLATQDCPFEPPPPRAHATDATWVRPTVVVEVAFAEWTAEGRLRHPTYVGRRHDVDATDVVADPTGPPA